MMDWSLRMMTLPGCKKKRRKTRKKRLHGDDIGPATSPAVYGHPVMRSWQVCSVSCFTWRPSTVWFLSRAAPLSLMTTVPSHQHLASREAWSLVFSHVQSQSKHIEQQAEVAGKQIQVDHDYPVPPWDTRWMSTTWLKSIWLQIKGSQSNAPTPSPPSHFFPHLHPHTTLPPPSFF